MLKTEKKGQWLEIIAPEEWMNFSVEHILKDFLHIPKPLLHQLRMSQGVKFNGQPIPWSTPIDKMGPIQIHLFIDEDDEIIPEYIDIPILYEDHHILIVNKPAGIDTHPTEKGQRGTLANAIAFHFEAQGLQIKARHIHRLDRDTTGAIIFAKERLTASLLDRMLEKREIIRTYVALVHGIIKQKSGKIDAPIGRDRHHPTRRRVSPSGQPAKTNFKVIHSYPKEKMTLIDLQLETGRTHQIRVHMSHLGFPLIGDVLYGGKPVVHRQALHAKKVQFTHPITRERIECNAPFLDQPPIFPIN